MLFRGRMCGKQMHMQNKGCEEFKRNEGSAEGYNCNVFSSLLELAFEAMR